MRQSKQERWIWRLVGLAYVSLSLSGCASFWDELTARNVTWKTKFHNMFTKQDPLVVAESSVDGDRRAKALRVLKEPKEHGGSDQEQDHIMGLLNRAAISDNQPLCRRAAIQRLGHCKDPRACKVLETAFINAGDFSPEIACILQCQVLTSMGETGNPEVVQFLVDKLKEPPAEGHDLSMQRIDRCTAAARALGKFKEARATEGLLQLLQEKKEDVALRDRAQESLVSITGKNLPADYQVWDDFLHPKNGDAVAKDKSRKINLVGWFTHSN